jgi:hypothetical protein
LAVTVFAGIASLACSLVPVAAGEAVAEVEVRRDVDGELPVLAAAVPVLYVRSG